MNHGMKAEVRKRKVKTGNPSHGTNCEGFVYTLEPGKEATANESFTVSKDSTTSDHNDSGSSQEDEYEKIVAICGVPPEQVPGGVLNFARSYRSYMRHVRILISDDDDDDEEEENDHYTNDDHREKGGMHPSNDGNDEIPAFYKNSTVASGTNVGSAKSTLYHDHDNLSSLQNSKEERESHYMVLVLLNTRQAADSFVRNLHGKPFNSFETNVVASVRRVVKIEGNCCSVVDENMIHHDHRSYLAAMPPTPHFSRMASIFMSPSLSLQYPPTNQNNILQIESGMNSPGRQRNRSLSMHSQSTTEVNNCPVCLEPMDHMVVTSSSFSSSLAHSSGHSRKHGDMKNNVHVHSNEQQMMNADAIFTTVCNHTFHMHCLLQWEDAPCPVCRFDHAGLNQTLSRCHECGSTEKVYVCLICGVASCSGIFTNGAELHRKQNQSATNHKTVAKQPVSGGDFDTLVLPCGHARQHYDDTLHAYAVDTETQHVWDFVGQGFVHRLIQNFDDGKIVEVADPTNTTSGERSLIPGLTDAEEEEVIHRKLEEYANEYNHLLKDQLEQQRLYFEGILLQMKREHEIHNLNSYKSRSPSSSALISALKQDLNQLQQRYHSLELKSKKVTENISFLKNMNESLEANKEPMQKEIKTLEQSRFEYSEKVKRELPMLEDKIKSLMLQLG